LDAAATERQRLARQAVIDELRERDRRDRNRAESPLRPAEDAVILDSTAMTLEEVLAEAERIVRGHLPQEPSGECGAGK
jgi:cytidylate kinase